MVGRRPRRRLVGVAVAVVLTMSAAVVGIAEPTHAGDVDANECPVDALRSDEQVQITFWHQMQGKNEAVLEQLVADFEARHANIEVELQNQVSYRDLFTKYKAGLRRDELPDLGQFEDTTPQQLVDSNSTIPIAACVKADDYSLKDFYDRPIAFYTVQGQLRAMPWNVSNIVTMFNRKAVAAAGLDPDALPTTLEGLRRASQQIVDRGIAPHGMALAIIPYVNEFLFAKSGVPYVNHANGRDARATAAVFDSKKGEKIWEWWDEMVDSGLALNTGAQEGGIDHLLALGNGSAAITIDSSGGIGRIYDVLSTGQFPNVEFGVAPLPSLSGGGGIPVGDGSLWIPKTGQPERQAAAWKLIKFLLEPEQIARLVVDTNGGYIPIRKSAAADPSVERLYAERPFLRVPFDQLELGPINPTTSGPVIGDYQAVRDFVREGLERMLTEGQAPTEALAEAARESTAAIEEFNQRLGR